MAAKPKIKDMARWQAAHSCTCFNIRKAARAVTQMYDEILRPTGLKGTQFSVLFALSAIGRVPIGKLADGMVMDRTTLSRNLKPLISKGYLHLVPGRDKRSRILELTPAGAALVDEALPLWEQAQARMMAGLGAERWARMRDDLSRAVEIAQGGRRSELQTQPEPKA